MNCAICQKMIEGNPWISIRCDSETVIHGCSYICDTKMEQIVGNNYYDKVINKCDFNYLFPIITGSSKTVDITHQINMEDLLREIEEEQEWVELMEQEYEQSSESDDDWENSE